MSGADFGGMLDRVGFGLGFRLFSRFFVVSRSFLVACLVWNAVFAFGARSACYGYEILGIRVDGKNEKEDGGRGDPHALHLLAGEELWWENRSHHYRATHLSGDLTGLELSWFCITPSTRLKNLHLTIRHDDSDSQSPSNHPLISFLLLSFVSYS